MLKINSDHLPLRFIRSARLGLQITKKPLGFGEKSHGLLVQNLRIFNYKRESVTAE
jgi:hypothetical protein